jgi:hypothetical protein
VGITQLPPPARPSPSRSEAFVTGGAYALVFLLGLAEGVLGAFQYSRGALGSFPFGAVCFDVAILLTCTLCGWAMRGMPGALLPAIGWFVASFGLAMPNAGGSVIIANTSAGEWYLYGGSICALLGVVSMFATVLRRPAARPAAPPPTRNSQAPSRTSRPPDSRSSNGNSPSKRNRTADGDVPPA